MAGHSKPPPSDPPDHGRCPAWMIGDDELQHTIALQMRVRSNDDDEAGTNEARLPADPFIVGNAVLLALGPSNARKVSASKEARGARYILRTNSKAISEQLQKITELPDKTPIEVIPHPTLNFVQGLVYDVDTVNHTEEALLVNLRSQGICKVRRIKKREGETYRNTPLLVLSFEGSVVPQHVYFGLLRIAVKTYYPSPLLCFRCANYGHSKKACDSTKFPEVCLNCSDSHEKVDVCQNPPFCKNCQGDHKPIAKVCPNYRQEEAIIQVKVDRNLSYAEARANWRAVNSNRSYANTVQDRLRHDETEKDKIIKTLQQEVESLRNVILELKTQISSLNNTSQLNASASTSTPKPKGQTIKNTVDTGSGRIPVVALNRLSEIEQYSKHHSSVKSALTSNSNSSLNEDPDDNMGFEMTRSNKRKGTKNKSDPESPERKKGGTSSSKKK